MPLLKGKKNRSDKGKKRGPQKCQFRKRKDTPDLTGHRFGRFVVISHAGYNRHNRKTWVCRCDCGNEKVVDGINLKNSNTKSCGCLASELRKLPTGRKPKGILEFGIAAKNATIGHYRVSAKRRGHVWNLLPDEAEAIFRSDCHYCGSAPCHYTKTKRMNGGFSYMGIDRADSSRGYDRDNVVPCCKRCNIAKNDMTYAEFVAWIERVHTRLLDNRVSHATA